MYDAEQSATHPRRGATGMQVYNDQHEANNTLQHIEDEAQGIPQYFEHAAQAHDNIVNVM